MASWAALNTSVRLRDAQSAQQRETEEAQEAKNAQLYEQALRYQHHGQLDDARSIYMQLLEANSGLNDHLRYLCNKNLATIELERQQYEKALQFFAHALEIDTTDVIVWYQMAQTALETRQLWLARRLLEEGAQVDATYWPLFELLCQVLYVVGDIDNYHRVAAYVVEHNPASGSVYLIRAEMDTIDAGNETRTRYRREAKQLQHLKELAADATAEGRSSLVASQQILSSGRSEKVDYLLQTPSWQALGKLLLEAFEDVLMGTDNNDANENGASRHVQAKFVRVCVQAEFENKSQDVEMALDGTETPSKEQNPSQTMKKEQTSGDECTEASEIVDLTVADGDELAQEDEQPTTQVTRKRKHSASSAPSDSAPDDVIVISDDQEELPRRRKSRRHEERLREEHAAAAKEAREKDLTYRLQQFLEIDVFARVRKQQKSLEWTLGCQVTMKDGAFVVKTDGETLTWKAFEAPNDLANRHSEPPTASDNSNSSDQDETAPPTVKETDICEFLNTMAHCGNENVVEWLIAFLNRCGEWAQWKLAAAPEEIQTVCLWVERVLCESISTEMKRPKPLVRNQPTGHPTGLSTRAKLFLLELQLDVLIRQPMATAKARKKRKKDMHKIMDRVQHLVLEMSLADDSPDQKMEFVRVFWLFGRLYGHLGNANAARSFFLKCEAALDRLEAPQPIKLPNLVQEGTISKSILQNKIVGLQFSDVCAEARVCFMRDEYDKVLTLLLPYFFPSEGGVQVMELLKDVSGTNDQQQPLLEIILEAANASTSLSEEQVQQLELTIVYHVTQLVLDQDQQHSALVSIALQVLERMMKQPVDSRRESTLVFASCCLRVLDARVLLLFESPVAVFERVVEQLSADPSHASMVLKAAAHTFHVIRSFQYEDFKALFQTLATENLIKRKPSRRDRVRALVVRLVQFLLEHDHMEALERYQRLQLMADCSKLMKEEEETVAQQDDKVARLLFGSSAALFLVLFGFERTEMPPKAIPSLVHLLHHRMGQYTMCDVPLIGKSKATFVDVCVEILSTITTTAHSKPRSNAPATETPDGSEQEDHSDDESDEDEDETSCEEALAQCFRCLYDVQIIPATDDHKTSPLPLPPPTDKRSSRGNEQATRDRLRVLNLAKFCIPIFLRKPPKSNAQKRENLKILYGIRDTLLGPDGLHTPSTPRSNELKQFLMPAHLLEAHDCPMAAIERHVSLVQSQATTDEAAMLDELWYLLGENFILTRVRRRGVLTELIEMEQKVKERAAFLIKDVTHCHPDRIASWTRLGKAIKELYHACTDASALIIGSELKSQALLSYATAFLDPMQSIELNEISPPRFHEFVMRRSVFQIMKDWDDCDGTAAQELYQVDVNDEIFGAKEKKLTIEDFVVQYAFQLIEFALRCFNVAGKLASKAATKPSKDDDEEEKRQEQCALAADSFEECGLLLYNVLQEYALVKRQRLKKRWIKFPFDAYKQLTDQTLRYFEAALNVSEGCDQQQKHEFAFRLHYMIGKTLKKKKWCTLEASKTSVAIADMTAMQELRTLTTTMAREIMDHFAAAERARREGELEDALIQAFYALQAVRMELLLMSPVRTENLMLVASNYYVPDEEEDQQDAPNQSVAGKDVVLKLISGDDQDHSAAEARALLFFNVVSALESIPDEDRYFHPSRFVLTWGFYHLRSIFPSWLQRACENVKDSDSSLIALREKQRLIGTEGPLEHALKAMAPLFDKKRPQIVAIWLSEYVSTVKKFEELNQRQQKYDAYRLKYWRLYIRLLEESEAYGRLKEVGSWVLACKEEHDVIDEMLWMVLRARANVLRVRMQRFLGGSMMVTTPVAAASVIDLSIDDPPALLKQLAKVYTYYVDVVESIHRLEQSASDDRAHQLLENAENLLVAMFLIGVCEHRAHFPDVALRDFDASGRSVATIVAGIRENFMTFDDNGAFADWRLSSLDATRAFCEAQWPERMGKGKLAKQRLRLKPSVEI